MIQQALRHESEGKAGLVPVPDVLVQDRQSYEYYQADENGLFHAN